MKDELHMHRAFKYAADMQRLEKQGYIMCDINKIIEMLEDKASEHAITGQQFDEDDWNSHAQKEYCKRDGIYEAIEIVKAGVKHD